MKHKPLVKEIIVYGIIGILCASVDSTAYVILTRTCSLDEFLANFIGVNVGISLSFVLNTFLNFKKTNNLKVRGVSFFCVGYCGLGLSMVLLYVGYSKMGMNDIFVKFLSIFIVAVFQFILNKIITYGVVK